MPDISIVMAVYNEEIFIEEALDSILNQAGPEIELIVVDDMSTDSTFDILKSRAQLDSRVRIYRVEEKGKVRAFNKGVSLARGKWVCLFAGDDIMPEGSLEARYNAVKLIDTDSALIGTCRLTIMSEDKRLNGQIIPRNPEKQTYSGVCFLMNRAAVSCIWPVPEQLPNEDTWMEMAGRYLDIRSIPTSTIGAKWRLHSQNSINMLVSFDEFNRKLSLRMVAAQLFLDHKRHELSARSVKALEAHARCERARAKGSPLGIALSGVSVVDMLRAIAFSGPLMYALRRKAYRLFSGW